MASVHCTDDRSEVAYLTANQLRQEGRPAVVVTADDAHAFDLVDMDWGEDTYAVLVAD